MDASFQAAQVSALTTQIICGAIVLILAFGLVQRRRAYRERKAVDEFTRLAPAGAISLGIFGTFLGIYLGLLDFDTQNINASIPDLLAGLKTAFITSLVGMVSSLGLRYQSSYFDNKESQDDAVLGNEPVELLRRTASGIVALSDKVNEIGDTVVKCFRADEEYSLLSQLKLIRTEVSDLKKEVTSSLDEFSAKVAELGTEAMIKALREVIADFNAKLNDLVGAEFKALKDAMIKLVEWQEHHRNAVDQMQQQLNDYLAQVRSSVELLERAANTLQAAGEHLDGVDASLSALSVSAADIEAHVEALKGQNAQLSELLVQVKSLGEEAKTVLPAVSAHINDATQALSRAAEGARSDLQEASSKVTQVVTSVSKSIEDSASAHSEQVMKSMEEISKGLETTLDASLRSLAGQLATLSGKFAEDYTPLTNRLREVVRLAEGLDNANRV